MAADESASGSRYRQSHRLKEGSQAQLPAPSPRGTVHDSFPSHGSSSTKASIGTSLTRELGMLPERPSRYTSAAAVHVFRQCWGRTRPVLQRSFAFPHTNGSTNFFATCHQSDVGPLSCQVTLKPVSTPLQRGIRFFQYPRHYSAAFASSNILLPHHHRQTLRPAVSRKRAIRGFHVPLAEVCRVRRLLSTGRRMGHESERSRRCSHLHHRFGSSVKATSACST